MKQNKKIVALALAVILLLGLLAGCQDESEDADEEAEEETTEEAVQDETDEDEDGDDGEEAEETVVIKVDDEEIYSGEFTYWVNNIIQSLLAAYGEIEDWTAEYADGRSFAQYAMEEAADTAVTYRIIAAWAEERGVSLSDEDWAEIEDAKAYDIEYYDGEDAMWEYLDAAYMTEELYDYIYEMNTLYSVLYTDIVGEDGANYTDEQVLDFAGENDMMQARQVMLMNVDDDGEALDDEAIQANYATLESLLTQLDESDDPAALFDELVAQYNEDADAEALPDGYLFAPGEMLEEFEEACAELGEYGYSGIVESEFGYHIIMRVPINPDAIPVYYYSSGLDYSLRQILAEDDFQTQMAERKEEAGIIYTINYDTYTIG